MIEINLLARHAELVVAGIGRHALLNQLVVFLRELLDLRIKVKNDTDARANVI